MAKGIMITNELNNRLEDDLLTTAEAAKALGVHPLTLARWRKNDVGPPYKQQGRKWLRYSRSGISDWLGSPQFIDRLPKQ